MEMDAKRVNLSTSQYTRKCNLVNDVSAQEYHVSNLAVLALSMDFESNNTNAMKKLDHQSENKPPNKFDGFF